jgi:hypothetical protein
VQAGESKVDRHSGGEVWTRRIDRAIGELASRQNGVVARSQLLDLRIRADAIDYRVARGRLHVVYRGVYAVGHPLLGAHGRWSAAVLAGGPAAVLSHRSAGALWRIRQWSGAHEVTVESWRPSGRGIRWRTRQLAADEITTEHGIRVTVPSRTLFDLASVLSRRDLERAIEEAEYRQLRDTLSLPVLLDRYPTARGTAALAAILRESRLGSTVTRSALEELLVAVVDRFGLPRPELNVWMQIGDGRWIEADAVWREQRLILELDGRAAHARGRNFESDRARDRAATVAGWRPIRVTWRQLSGEAAAFAADLERLLGPSGPA